MHGRERAVVETVSIVDQHESVAQAGVRRELALHGRGAGGVVDPGDRAPKHAEPPRQTSNQRAAPGARWPFESQHCAGRQRLSGFEQLARDGVDAGNGPKHAAGRSAWLLNGHAQHAPHVAREFVDRRVTIFGRASHRSPGHGAQLANRNRAHRLSASFQDLGQHDAERKDLGPHRDRLAFEQLGRRVARRQAFDQRAPLAPGCSQAQVDEHDRAFRLDDDVRRLHVAVQQASPVQHRELFGGARQNLERHARLGAAREQSFQALALHDFADQVRPPGAGQPSKSDHARYAQAL